MKFKEKISIARRIVGGFRGKARLLLTVLSILGMGAYLTGCGGGGSDSANADNGEVIIGITDAPGDFQTYTVDVVSLTLTKANGTVVETLPVQTRVDFAQYTQMTEFLTAATVPSGVYTSASMVLDYSNADIQVENDAGDTVPVTMIKDEDTNDIAELDLRVQLSGRNRLLIAPGVPASLTLDFDLKASNEVTFDTEGAPTVIVAPFLVADVDLDKNKTHRLRGALKSVNVAEENFNIIVRPFHHHINRHDHRFGSIKVNTNSETVFEIDDVVYSQAEGLEQLNSLPTFSATITFGEIKYKPRRFEATHVFAGSSVPGGDRDVVHGNVIARSGNILTVKGATLIRKDGTAIFRDSVSVKLAETTKVHRQHSTGEYSIADISVGQRVHIFGILTNDTPERLEMDATQGHVSLRFTTLRGNAIVTDATSLNAQLNAKLNTKLRAIDRRAVNIFDFSGTGVTPDDDADPMAYEIETGDLAISSIADGARIMARGFVRPFGQAPADFEARTIVKLATVTGHLGLSWNPATMSPFIALSATEISLNLEGHGMFHYIVRAGERIDMISMDQPPVLQPTDSDDGIYILHVGDVIELFTAFGPYVDALDTQIAAGKTFKGIRAKGVFEDSTGIMKATMISVRVM